MPEIWIIYRKVHGKPEAVQVLNNGRGWALAHIGAAANLNRHLDVRLFFTEKERVLGLRQTGATYKGSNVPKFMTLDEFIVQTTPPKKEERKEEGKKK